MARRFNGTTQALNTSATLDLTAYTRLTVAFWLWWTAFAADDKLAFESSANYNTNAGAILGDPDDSGTGLFTVNVRNAAVGGYSGVSFTRPSAGKWHHYTFTFDLGNVTRWVPDCWVDGATPAGLVTAAGSAVTGPATGFSNYTWYFMSRGAASLFGAGQLCEVALWPGTLLAPTEVFRLAKGAPPSEVRPGALKYYWPIAGDLNPDVASRSSAARLVPVAAPSAVAHAPVLPAVSPPRRLARPPAAAFVAPEPYVVRQAVTRAAFY
jgi:hypothetical protein